MTALAGYNGNTTILPTGVTTVTSQEFDLQGLTTTDTISLFKLPAGFIVLGAMIYITESAGETCTVDIGFTGSADVFLANGNMNQAAGTLVVATIGAAQAAATVYDAAKEILLTCDGGTTYAAGKGRVSLLVGKL